MGNMKLNLVMGARNSSKTEREENDFYATHPSAVVSFLEKLKRDNIKISDFTIWEPACGMGHISDVFRNAGYNVFSSDIIDRGYEHLNELHNFLDSEYNPVKEKKCIVTNPPFKYAEEFAYSAMDKCTDGDMVMFFLKIQFLESKSRKVLFEKFPPKYVYVYSERQQCAKDGDFELYTAKTLAYIWVIWEKGNSSETVLRWI